MSHEGVELATVDATPGTLVVVPRLRLSPRVLAVQELIEDPLAASAVPRTGGAARPAPLHHRRGGRKVASGFSCGKERIG